jgi:hypothetical protein
MRALVLALALAACGEAAPTKQAPNAEIATTSGFDLSGHLIAQGADFRLDSAPDIGVVLVYPANELTVSGPYAVPVATDTGALLESQGISLVLTPSACTLDGVTYPMSATVTIPNARPAEGCAMIRWDNNLIELLPQIDACIANSPETTWISYAADTGEGLVTVRMQGHGRGVDCTVPNDSADPQHATISPRRAEFRPAGDGEALFVRGSSGPNPGGECMEAPEVRGANGELLGWMMDPMGC